MLLENNVGNQPGLYLGESLLHMELLPLAVPGFIAKMRVGLVRMHACHQHAAHLQAPWRTFC